MGFSDLVAHSVQLALGSHIMHFSRVLNCPTQVLSPGQRSTAWSETEGVVV